MLNSDQTGFMEGRFIGDNIRLIDGIINYTAEGNLPGLLLFLDFEKAFDTVKWNFIQEALEIFGFGSSFVQWINMCYNNIESCILNNSWSTDLFKLGRGVRQGFPLSPYVFTLCVEVLPENIWETKSIKGITISQNDVKISHMPTIPPFFLMDQKNLSYQLYKSWKILERFRA